MVPPREGVSERAWAWGAASRTSIPDVGRGDGSIKFFVHAGSCRCGGGLSLCPSILYGDYSGLGTLL